MNYNINLKCKAVICGFALSLLIACQQDTPANHAELLLGKWQATDLMEQDSVLDIDLGAVELQFYPEGNYGFHGTLKEQEAGTYRVQKDLLFTRDTLVKPPHEKVVKILKLTADSLQIEMLDKDKKRILDLQKQK